MKDELVQWVNGICDQTKKLWGKTGSDKRGYAIFYSPDVDLVSQEFYSYLSSINEEKMGIVQKLVVLYKSAFEKIPLHLSRLN